MRYNKLTHHEDNTYKHDKFSNTVRVVSTKLNKFGQLHCMVFTSPKPELIGATRYYSPDKLLQVT